MPRLNRGDANLHYEVHGEGPTILLSHGFSCTSEMWADQVEPLSRRNRLVLWDMRGHGRSDYPADEGAYSEEATVSDMVALLDAVEAPQAVIGGLSLGGYMSLAFRAHHPHRVTALMLASTGPGYRKDVAREKWNETARKKAERYRREGLRGLGDGGEAAPLSRHRSPEGLVLAARGMLTQRDGRVIESLPRIAAPTLVVVGAEDAAFLGAADYMAAKISHAHKVVIPDAGHMVNVDQPARFNAEVCSFLDKLGTRAGGSNQ